MDNRASDIQLGELIHAVDTLTSKIEKMDNRLDSLEDKYTLGKGVLVGAIMAAGGTGAAIWNAIRDFF